MNEVSVSVNNWCAVMGIGGGEGGIVASFMFLTLEHVFGVIY